MKNNYKLIVFAILFVTYGLTLMNSLTELFISVVEYLKCCIGVYTTEKSLKIEKLNKEFDNDTPSSAHAIGFAIPSCDEYEDNMDDRMVNCK